jgi:hypothetical protein
MTEQETDKGFEKWASKKPTVPEEIKDLQRRITQLTEQLKKYRSGTRVIEDTLQAIFEVPPEITVPTAPRRSKKPNIETAVLHVADTQFGKETSSYNMEVARKRLMVLASKVVAITETRRAFASIDTLHLYLGGDLVEGEDIFPHQAHLIDRPLLEQAVDEGPSIFVSMILYLLEHFRQIKVFSIWGNHGRVSKRAHPHTNWDTICAKVIKGILLGSSDNPRRELKDRLTIDIADKDFYIVDTLPGGWGNLLVHGHQIKGYSTFPFYQAGVKVARWADIIDTPWDYLFFGHFHTFGSLVINYRLWLANGSIETDNDYAREHIGSQNHPCQRLSFFSESQGLISDHQVFVEPRIPQAKRFQ